MNRAYSTLEIKAVNDATRKFRGIASTPVTDTMGDIVEPKGAEFTLPMPFLWMHDSSDPIGWITAAKITASGIEVDGEVAQIDEDGPLKERLSKAWQMMKAKLVRGLSIGFKPLESARIENSLGYRFTKYRWLELSAVTIPANQEASITMIKSIDIAQLASSGKGLGGATPGVSGQSVGNDHTQRKRTMKTIQEMRAERETKAARVTELVEGFKAADRQSTDEEATEVDALMLDLKALDDEIRVAKFHGINAAAAKSVDGSSHDSARASRSSQIIVKSGNVDEAFKGQNYTRVLIAKAIAKITGDSAGAIAQYRWGRTQPALVQLIKTAVAGGGTGSGEWGAELTQSDTRFTGDFIEFLYSKTVFDTIPLRRVPARIHIKGQDGAATGYWRGESKAIPVSKSDYSDVELTPLSVGAISVISNELMMDADPSAEMLVRDSLAEASAQRIDTTFLSTTAASSGVSPAGLLNGLTGLLSSGTDGAAVRADVKTLYRPFLTAKNASGLVYVMHPSTAKAISLLVNSLGLTEFPGLNATGGMLLGDTVYTGDNCAVNDIILMKPSDIYRIGDTGVQITMSNVATLEQDSSPAGASDTPSAASATLMSMFQTESTAFKVVRRVNFAKRRTSAVAFITDADYDSVES